MVLNDDNMNSECANRNHLDTFPYVRSCQQYVLCENGRGALHNCPQSQVFHPYRGGCGQNFNDIRCNVKSQKPNSYEYEITVFSGNGGYVKFRSFYALVSTGSNFLINNVPVGQPPRNGRPQFVHYSEPQPPVYDSPGNSVPLRDFDPTDLINAFVNEQSTNDQNFKFYFHQYGSDNNSRGSAYYPSVPNPPSNNNNNMPPIYRYPSNNVLPTNQNPQYNSNFNPVNTATPTNSLHWQMNNQYGGNGDNSGNGAETNGLTNNGNPRSVWQSNVPNTYPGNPPNPMVIPSISGQASDTTNGQTGNNKYYPNDVPNNGMNFQNPQPNYPNPQPNYQNPQPNYQNPQPSAQQPSHTVEEDKATNAIVFRPRQHAQQTASNQPTYKSSK